MRALFEDQTFYAAAFPDIRIDQVNLPQNVNRRDVWFRFFPGAGGLLSLRVYKTRAEAKTTSPPAGYIATADIATGSAAQTIVLQHGDISLPDMTGMSIIGTFLRVAEVGVVWGYEAAPDATTADNMRTRILAHSGTGQQFDGIRASQITVYDASQIKDFVPCGINIVPGDPQAIGSDGPQKFAMSYPFTIQVATDRLSRAEPNALQCRRYAAALRAMFCSDYRRSYGEVHVVTFEHLSQPEMVGGNEAIVACDLGLRVDYRNFWRDDKSPKA